MIYKLGNWRIFPSTAFRMDSNYKSDIKRAFNYTIQNLNYKKETGRFKTIINNLVKIFTDGKIKDILTTLNPESACVRPNCIYFKGD